MECDAAQRELKKKEDLEFKGSCYCGRCQFICKERPLFSTICHCSICTRISGGIAVALVGFSGDSLQLVKGIEDLKSFKSSDQMERFHCRICSSSVYNQSLSVEKSFRDTPLMNFSRDGCGHIMQFEILKPDSHIFFGNCQLECLGMFRHDRLTKFSEMPGSEVLDQ